jgi:hypothetical protein
VVKEPKSEQMLAAEKRDLRMVQELLDSEGWTVILNRVVLPDMARSMQASCLNSLARQHELASMDASRYEAMMSFVEGIYKKAERDLPDELRKIKKGRIQDGD